MPEIRFGFILFLVAALACVGQVSNTIFVPAMSMIANDFSIAPGVVQLVMGLYLLCYGSSQFVHGPLSDWFGRRPIVIVGLSIFFVGSVLSAFAPSFSYLLLGCATQGIGIGVGGMMIRTVMRDLYTGRRLHTASSYMSAVLILAPLVAPVLGGVLSQTWGWRSNYIFLSCLSMGVLLMEYRFLPETNQFIRQPHTHLSRTLAEYKMILSHAQFQTYMNCLFLTFAGVSVIEAVMGLLFGSVLHFSPARISLLFILPLPAYLLGSYLAARLNKKFTLDRIILFGIVWLALGAFSMLLSGMLSGVTVFGILLPAILFFFGSGVLFPTATAGALEPFGKSAGKAGALLGGFQNLGSGGCALVSAMLPQHTQVPLGCMLVVLTFLIFIKVRAVVRVGSLKLASVSEDSVG